MIRAALLATALVAVGCTTPDGELASLARQRLALAPDVAWTKFSRDIPVYDPARETTVLQSAMEQGRLHGVPEETTRRFFAAEMEASRRLQWEWIHAWRKGYPQPVGAPRDLVGDLRPRFDDIQRHQITALARGAKPLTISQLTEVSERFLPKN
ncbi:MAG: gamma subclass chorismate mutase AroQ [Chthoniobacterales bacterium]|nr:gamma subclass chorismate mutase AroQ [Chthoniobacterales bacterium]